MYRYISNGNQMIFNPCCQNAIQIYINKWDYNECVLHDVTWNGMKEVLNSQFTGLFKIFTDKIVTIMNTTGLVAYPVHLFFFRVSFSYRQWIFINGFTQAGLIYVKYMNSEDKIHMAEDLLSFEN